MAYNSGAVPKLSQNDFASACSPFAPVFLNEEPAKPGYVPFEIRKKVVLAGKANLEFIKEVLKVPLLFFFNPFLIGLHLFKVILAL